MKARNSHVRDFVSIIILMVFTVILTSTMIFSIGKAGWLINYSLIVIYALVSGFVSAKVIDRIEHKDKREILAGSLIPLPATICMIIYLLVLGNLKSVESISPVISSAAFFICFNIPFLVLVYEHKKHKHHLVGLMIAPLVLAVVYLFAYFLTLFISADYITPQIVDSFTLSYEVAPVRNFVEDCMKSVGEEALRDSVDVKEFIDSNLDSCIGSFSAFQGLDIRAGNHSSEVIYGDSTVTIRIYYPVSFSEGNFDYRIDDFQTTIER